MGIVELVKSIPVQVDYLKYLSGCRNRFLTDRIRLKSLIRGQLPLFVVKQSIDIHCVHEQKVQNHEREVDE